MERFPVHARKLFRAALFATSLVAAFSTPLAEAQTVTAAQQVQQLAPQLVAFAGSQGNFDSLVNGLAQGLPVALVGTTADGLQQTATFTPAGQMSAVQIAQLLERARQSLITQGISAPTPEQIGVALLGGRLPTQTGTTSVVGVLPATQAASIGSSSAQGVVTGSPSLTVSEQRPSAVSPAAVIPGAVQPPTMTSATPFLGNTSNTPFTQNTSNSPLPTGVPGAATANGSPSPAAQMQGRR